jgi:hypothetical protein
MKLSCKRISIVAALSIPLAFSTLTAMANQRNESALKAGEPFAKARARIIKLGWQPVRMHRNDRYEYSGTEKELAARGFIEVASCSVDAGSLCIFYYRKALECLRLDTKGEHIKFMEVTRWTNECPESS